MLASRNDFTIELVEASKSDKTGSNMEGYAPETDIVTGYSEYVPVEHLL
jgi:hypothetical protein